MAYEVLRSAPKAEDFTLLDEHQEQTPQTFFGARPVLHLHCPNAKVTISKADLAAQSDFAALQTGDAAALGAADAPVEIEDVNVWVSSRQVTLSPSLPRLYSH